MSVPTPTRTRRAGTTCAVLAGAAVLGPLLLAPPAAAADPGQLSVQQDRRAYLQADGDVVLRATVSCSPGTVLGELHGYVGGGSSGSATGSRELRVRCDGAPHRVHVVLDEQDGRVLPGGAAIHVLLEGTVAATGEQVQDEREVVGRVVRVR